MVAELKSLIALQTCDSRIKNILDKKEEAPLKIQRFEEELKFIEKQLEEVNNLFESCKQGKRRAEREVEELEARVEKSNTKLSNIRSNKEYTAALKEIDDLKEERSRLEDQVLGFMEEIELLETRHHESEKERNEFISNFEKERESIQNELKSLDAELGELKKDRIRICQDIDETLLKKYDFLIEHKGGLAITSVIKGVCQACHLGIPPQKFNELIRGEELMRCPNCMRIIYWGEDERLQKKVDQI